jgi:hypothetical protein
MAMTEGIHAVNSSAARNKGVCESPASMHSAGHVNIARHTLSVGGGFMIKAAPAKPPAAVQQAT